MFSKAKLKRFNETVGCAPPPTKYNTKVEAKIPNVAFDKSGRFIDGKENTPGPNAYMGIMVKPIVTPRKKVLSIPKLNVSTCSSSSASSQTGFLSPPTPFMRSKSLRNSKQKDSTQRDLQSKIEELTTEREALQYKVEELEERMLGLNLHDVKVTEEKQLCESSTQVDDIVEPEDLTKQQETSPMPNSIMVTTEQYQLMKDELEHLTLLRDNLENSIAKKEDLIADLHGQVDLMVEEAQEHQNNSIYFKEEVDKLLDELNRTAEERKLSELKVASLIAKYEALINHHCTEEQTYRDNIAQKDVTIELLNDSISTLSTKISEYGNQLSKIPNLEMRIGDLSLESKEKEVIGTLLQSELDEKYTQVVKLEDSLLGVERKVNNVKKERDELLNSLTEEKQLREEMGKELDQLRIHAKESEVLQQFLEKEINSREVEISEYGIRIQSLESDFESTKQLAMDLQQDAEAQLNQLFCLKASLSAKEYDIEAKDDQIEELKEEIHKRCHEKCDDSDNKSGKVLLLEEELHTAREFMRSARDNTSQLEEKLIQLLAEIGEREEVHKKRILEKDSELEELSVKYSDALLEQDDIKRVLNHTSEDLEKQKMIIHATDMELTMVKSEFKHKVEQNMLLERSTKELTLKLTHLEDALACEEAESKNLQDKLQEKIGHLKDCLTSTKEELAAVKSSNSGFISQITQLRIDMQKKCCAVDEMQGCIDALRQEKSELNSSYNEMRNSFNDKETLLNDLQNEFEGKLKNITELREQIDQRDNEIMEKDDQNLNISNQFARLTVETEEAEKLYSSRIDEVKSQWMKEQKLRIALEAKAADIQDGLCSLREEKDKIINDLSSNLSEKESQISTLERNLQEIEAKYEGYDDQIKNLQISLTEKTTEVDGFERSHNEINLAVESQQESSVQLKSQLKRLEEDYAYMNKSMQDKDQMLSDLNFSILQKSDELHELQKEMTFKEDKINELKNSLSMVREELESSLSQIESCNEKMAEFDNIMEQKQDNESSLRTKMEELINDLANLRMEQATKENEVQQVSDSLQEGVHFWKSKFEYLEKMIEPFKEQLNAYDLERASLVSESRAANQELDKLSQNYAQLLGHTNHKQKIQHVVKLKDENSHLKKEVLKMRHDIDNLRQANRKLEEQTGARHKTTFSVSKRENKENSGAQCSNLSPLRGSNKVNRI